MAGEGAAAEEAEGLVADLRAVGVDAAEVDLVASRGEALDQVERARGRFAGALVAERVRPGAAGQHVVAEPTEEEVVAGAAGDDVRPGAAEHPEGAVRLGRAVEVERFGGAQAAAVEGHRLAGRDGAVISRNRI